MYTRAEAEALTLEPDAVMLVLGIFVIPFLFLVALGSSGEPAFWARAYIALGLGTIVLKAYLPTKRGENTTFFQELMYGIKSPKPIVMETFIFWFIDLPFALFGRGYWSFRKQYQNVVFTRIIEAPESQGMHTETALEFTQAQLRSTREQGEVLDQRAEAVRKTLQEAMTPVVCGGVTVGMLMTVVPNSAGGQQMTWAPPPTSLQIEVFSDFAGDRQVWGKFFHGNMMAISQSRLDADGRSLFSHLAIGGKLEIRSWLDAIVLFGPQYTWTADKGGGFDRNVLWFNVLARGRGLSFLSVNRFFRGLKDGLPLVTRHVQSLGGLPLLPSWLSLRVEELRTPNGWKDLYLGTFIAMKDWGIRILSKCSAYPYRDFAGGRWDMRLGCAYTF